MGQESLGLTAEELAGIGTDSEAPPATAPAASPPAPPPADPPAEPPSDPPAEEAEFEELTLEDIDERVDQRLEEKLRAAPPAPRAPAEDDDGAAPDPDAPPEVVKLQAENKALTDRLTDLERKDAEREQKLAAEALNHSIVSTAGKLKLTAEEIQGTVVYLESNPHLLATLGQPGGITFEEATMQRYPGIEARAKAPAVVPTDEGSLETPPAANGAGAPKPFKPTYTGRGDYSDITKYLLQSGEAAAIGKYT